MHAEVQDQRLVDAARQYPARVEGPGHEGQPREQGEEHGPANDAEVPRGDQPHLPLQPKRHVVDEGQLERRIDRLRAHDDRAAPYFTL